MLNVQQFGKSLWGIGYLSLQIFIFSTPQLNQNIHQVNLHNCVIQASLCYQVNNKEARHFLDAISNNSELHY
jgi:hypothetical protein